MAVSDPRPVGFGRMKRKEDARLIRGKGNFVDDVRLPGMLHGAVLRSPLAHARITSIDTSAAQQHPKVRAVITGKDLEGLERDGRLDPVQQGFIEEHGLQCGFCTPGMMLTARALLDENPNPTDDEIRVAISGQICRCTGYKNIIASIRWAAEHPEEVTA